MFARRNNHRIQHGIHHIHHLHHHIDNCSRPVIMAPALRDIHFIYHLPHFQQVLWSQLNFGCMDIQLEALCKCVNLLWLFFGGGAVVWSRPKLWFYKGMRSKDGHFNHIYNAECILGSDSVGLSARSISRQLLSLVYCSFARYFRIGSIDLNPGI